MASDGAAGPAARGAGRVAGVVLAAGRSARMGAPKALLTAGERTFVARLVDAVARGGCDPVVAVVRSAAGPLAGEATRAGARVAVNEGGQGGQIGSLRSALRRLQAMRRPPAAVVFTPVDNPAVEPATVRKLVDAWRASAAAVVTPRFGGRRGHPTLVDMSIAEEFFEPGLAEGARAVVRRDPGRALAVEVSDPGVLDDLDTPWDYEERYGGAGPASAGT